MKINYDLKMQDIIKSHNGYVPTLLLHSCCAPCSSACLKKLCDYFKVTIIYYNPNIEPYDEYLKRKEEQKRFIKEYKTKYPVDFLDCDYDHDVFVELSKGLEQEPERGKRCLKCYRARMEFTAVKAKELGFNYFSTTLTLSPLKDSQVLNLIGESLEKKYNIKFLYSDFKKRNGNLDSIYLSKLYNLYRQDYCGCNYSKIKNIED